MQRIVRERVSVDDINVRDGLLVEANSTIDELKKVDDYPWEDLQNSIKEHGFDPLFDKWSNHRDNGFFRPQPYVLNKHGDRYELPNGQRRTATLKRLGISEVEAYVLYDDYPAKPKEFYEQYMKTYEDYLQRHGLGMFQKLRFPHGLVMNQRRDESNIIFDSTHWDTSYWCGKNTLDIASNGGFFVFQSKLSGAANSVGFEIDDWMYRKSLETRDVLEVDVEIQKSDFWNFEHKIKKFDIVMCNQCIYHFGEGSRATDALERVASFTDNELIMYTFLPEEKNYHSDYRFGYRPTKEVIVKDLHDLGFKRVRIYDDIPGAKYTVVASKKPEMYPQQITPDTMIYTDYTEEIVKAIPGKGYVLKKKYNNGTTEQETICY